RGAARPRAGAAAAVRGIFLACIDEIGCARAVPRTSAASIGCARAVARISAASYGATGPDRRLLRVHLRPLHGLLEPRVERGARRPSEQLAGARGVEVDALDLPGARRL